MLLFSIEEESSPFDLTLEKIKLPEDEEVFKQ